jgi:hypothetical protein
MNFEEQKNELAERRKTDPYFGMDAFERKVAEYRAAQALGVKPEANQSATIVQPTPHIEMRARVTEPVSSQQAAGHVNAGRSKRVVLVLDLLKQHPEGLTVTEMCDLSGEEAQLVSPVMAPLARKGYVRKAGTRINPKSLCRQIVWQSTQVPSAS